MADVVTFPTRPRARLWPAALLAAAVALSPLGAEARGPESLADLAAQVTDSVVNISAATTVETRGRTMPQLPPGTPFEDLFEEFFTRRGQGPGGGPGEGAPSPRQRRSNSLGSGFVVD